MQLDFNFWAGVCVGFGLCFAIVVTTIILLDIELVRAGKDTVSRRNLNASRYSPIIAVWVAGVLCLIVGTLLGHLYFPQYVTPDDPAPVKGVIIRKGVVH